MDSISTRVDDAAPTGQSSWWCEAVSAEFQFAPEVLQTMRAESVDGLMRLARGGIELGGVLYGLRTADNVRILAARPLDCEHRFGPSFLFSDKDEAALQDMLDPAKQDEDVRGLEPLGWYVSHCRRGPALAESDVRISNQHFNRPGALTVVLLPEKSGQALARIFVRSGNGALDPETCAREMVLPGPIEMLQAHVAARPAPRPPKSEPPIRASDQALVVSPPAIPPVRATSVPAAKEPYHPWNPAPANIGRELPEQREVALNRLQSYLQQQDRHRRVSNWNLIATLSLLLVCALAAGTYFWMRLRDGAHGAATVVLRVNEVGSQLRIDWDPSLDAVQTATTGELEIRESDGPPVYAKVDHQALLAGSAVYNHRSDKVEIRMRLVYSNARQAESVVYFISPASAAVKPPEPPAVAPPAAARPDITPPVAKPDETAPRPVVATRTFKLPKVTRSEPAQVTLSSAPLPTSVELSPKPSPVLPFSTDSAAPPPPPAAPAPVAAKTLEPRPRFGRVIWTGELDRNALLTLSSTGASLGWANGRLPGFPVTVSLHPADLVAGGIQVYTRDEKLMSRAEPPSAENGWNTIVFKYDPKTAPDVHVIQAPSAANSWSQMVIQNGKKPISVVIIDWQRAPDAPRSVSP